MWLGEKKKGLTLTALWINQDSATDTVFGKIDSAEMGRKEGGLALFNSTPHLHLTWVKTKVLIEGTRFMEPQKQH